MCLRGAAENIVTVGREEKKGYEERWGGGLMKRHMSRSGQNDGWMTKDLCWMKEANTESKYCGIWFRTKRWIDVSGSSKMWKKKRVFTVQPPHFFLPKGYNFHEPTRGQRQSMWCQLHLSCQHFSPNFSICLSFLLYPSLPVSASAFIDFYWDLIQFWTRTSFGLVFRGFV